MRLRLRAGMNSVSSIRLTHHAYKRARQRLSWNSSTIERMSIKAFEEGLKSDNTNGRLKKYLDALWNKYKIANNLRVYGETVFIFSDELLITVWPLPYELRPLAKVMRLKLYISKAAAA